MLTTILLSIGIFAAMMLALTLGYLLSGRCISGSCGGPEVTRGDGEVVCHACGRAKEAPKPMAEDRGEHPESAS